MGNTSWTKRFYKKTRSMQLKNKFAQNTHVNGINFDFPIRHVTIAKPSKYGNERENSGSIDGGGFYSKTSDWDLLYRKPVALHAVSN